MTEATQQTPVCPKCGAEWTPLIEKYTRWQCGSTLTENGFFDARDCLRTQLAAALERAENAERERDDAKRRLEMWRNQFADRR